MHGGGGGEVFKTGAPEQLSSRACVGWCGPGLAVVFLATWALMHCCRFNTFSGLLSTSKREPEDPGSTVATRPPAAAHAFKPALQKRGSGLFVWPGPCAARPLSCPPAAPLPWAPQHPAPTPPPPGRSNPAATSTGQTSGRPDTPGCRTP